MHLWRKLDKSPQKSEKIASANFLNFIVQNRGYNSLILARYQDNLLHWPMCISTQLFPMEVGPLISFPSFWLLFAQTPPSALSQAQPSGKVWAPLLFYTHSPKMFMSAQTLIIIILVASWVKVGKVVFYLWAKLYQGAFIFMILLEVILTERFSSANPTYGLKMMPVWTEHFSAITTVNCVCQPKYNIQVFFFLKKKGD